MSFEKGTKARSQFRKITKQLSRQEKARYKNEEKYKQLSSDLITLVEKECKCKIGR